MYPECTVHNNSGDFHLFPKLPFELRLKIWKHLLDDDSPQMYRFSLHYQQRPLIWDDSLNQARSGDQLILQPIRFMYSDGDRAADCSLLPLTKATSTRRIASMICVQSRQVVLELYPDTFPFQLLPHNWGLFENGTSKAWDDSDRSYMREYIFRFNSMKDIVVLNANWRDMAAAVVISGVNGTIPESFSNNRHLGIAVEDLRIYLGRNMLGLPRNDEWYCEDGCASKHCLDSCQKDPLPRFLALFPLVESFYIAGVPSSNTHRPGDYIQSGAQPTRDAKCPCPDNDRKHSWPTIKSSDACGWFTVYDERSSCSFSILTRVEDIRRRRRANFPYYHALNHLQIQFIQPLTDPDSSDVSNSCTRCMYTL